MPIDSSEKALSGTKELNVGVTPTRNNTTDAAKFSTEFPSHDKGENDNPHPTEDDKNVDIDENSFGSNSDEVSAMTNPTFFSNMLDFQSVQHPTNDVDNDHYNREEFIMKEEASEEVASKMKERGGTPSESESSLDQSESGAPLIGLNSSVAPGVLGALQEANEELSTPKKSKSEEHLPFDPNKWNDDDDVNDPFFKSDIPFSNNAFSSEDAFGESFFNHSEESHVKGLFSPEDHCEFEDDPPLTSVEMLDSSDDFDINIQERKDIEDDPFILCPSIPESPSSHYSMNSDARVSQIDNKPKSLLSDEFILATTPDLVVEGKEVNHEKQFHERSQKNSISTSNSSPQSLDAAELKSHNVDHISRRGLRKNKQIRVVEHVLNQTAISKGIKEEQSEDNHKRNNSESPFRRKPLNLKVLRAQSAKRGKQDSVVEKVSTVKSLTDTQGVESENSDANFLRNSDKNILNRNDPNVYGTEVDKSVTNFLRIKKKNVLNVYDSELKKSGTNLPGSKKKALTRDGPNVYGTELHESEIKISENNNRSLTRDVRKELMGDKKKKALSRDGPNGYGTKLSEGIIPNKTPKQEVSRGSKLLQKAKQRSKQKYHNYASMTTKSSNESISDSSSRVTHHLRKSISSDKGGDETKRATTKLTLTHSITRQQKPAPFEQAKNLVAFKKAQSVLVPKLNHKIQGKNVKGLQKGKVSKTPRNYSTENHNIASQLKSTKEGDHFSSFKKTLSEKRLILSKKKLLTASSPLRSRKYIDNPPHTPKAESIMAPNHMRTPERIRTPKPIRIHHSIHLPLTPFGSNHSHNSCATSESTIQDRLLSAAAIPIQTEIRCYLAKQEAHARMWGLILIQAYTRRWFAWKYKTTIVASTIKIQTIFRGWLARDDLEDMNYCATQIQKVARGYLALANVYEELYNIILVQSIWREKMAIAQVDIRKKALVKIQSVVRSYNARDEISYLSMNALIIQALWRGYSTQLSYQFQIVDIIIVQSIFRQKAASIIFKERLYKKKCNSIVKIQTLWRSHTCTENYILTIGDILIVQSVVRRWLALRLFFTYRANIHFEMSTKIQCLVKSWLLRMKYKENMASVLIQATWRRYQAHVNMLFTLVNIIIAQVLLHPCQHTYLFLLYFYPNRRNFLNFF